MKRYILTILLFICITINGFSNDLNVSDCDLNFEKIGIRTFDIGVCLSDLKLNHPALDLQLIMDGIDLFDDFTFTEKAVINGKKKNITYYLNFRENQLFGYFFLLDGDQEYFNELSKALSPDTFINFNSRERNYSYYENNDACHKYFRIKIEENKMRITGGVESNLRN